MPARTRGLLRKMRFPRLVIPLSVALTALYQLGLNLIPVFLFAILSGVQPRLSWLELPLLVIPSRCSRSAPG